MEVIYEVKTKHTKEMIKQYVKFQNNVNAPTRKLQSVLIALCVFSLNFMLPAGKARIICTAIVVLILLRTLLDNWFMENFMKSEDANYKKQNEITYLFGKKEFKMENPNEEENITFSYNDITSLYKDEKYWYICMKGGELHMFLKNEVLNDDNCFGMHLEKKSGLKMKNAKPTFKEKYMIMQDRKEVVVEEKSKNPRKGLF